MSDPLEKYIDKLPPAILEKVREETKDLKAAEARKVADNVLEQFLNNQAEPGEAVGIVAAQSMENPALR